MASELRIPPERYDTLGGTWEESNARTCRFEREQTRRSCSEASVHLRGRLRNPNIRRYLNVRELQWPIPATRTL